MPKRATRAWRAKRPFSCPDGQLLAWRQVNKFGLSRTMVISSKTGTVKNHSLNSFGLREKARTVCSAWCYIILYNTIPHKFRSAVKQKVSSSGKDFSTEGYCTAIPEQRRGWLIFPCAGRFGTFARQKYMITRLQIEHKILSLFPEKAYKAFCPMGNACLGGNASPLLNKERENLSIFPLFVIPKRFERLTHALEGRCSIQLSYGTYLFVQNKETPHLRVQR